MLMTIIKNGDHETVISVKQIDCFRKINKKTIYTNTYEDVDVNALSIIINTQEYIFYFEKKEERDKYFNKLIKDCKELK